MKNSSNSVTRFFEAVIPHFFLFVSLVCVSLCSSLIFSGCAGSAARQGPAEKTEDIPDPRLVNWELLDYRNSSLGETVPAWVILYLAGGNRAVEELEAYEDYYVFVSQNTGTVFGALEQWMSAFSPELDFARLVTVRIEKYFLDAAYSYPDDEYGAYYEALIRFASDAEWTGAVKDADFWLLRRFPEADGLMVRDEMFDFLVLVKIEKALLVPQIRTLFQNVQPRTALSRDQNTAVLRAQEQFFDNF